MGLYSNTEKASMFKNTFRSLMFYIKKKDYVFNILTSKELLRRYSEISIKN